MRRPRPHRVVAEGLAQHTRHRLVRRLHARGLTDVEVAAATAMSTYTSWRIRAHLGLAPNPCIDRTRS